MSRAQWPGKYPSLREAHRLLAAHRGPEADLPRETEPAQVPAAVLLAEGFFRSALQDYDAVNRDLDRILEEIAGTSGAFLGEHMEELEAVTGRLRWHPRAEERLRLELAAIVEWEKLGATPLAVRSSAPHEDSDRRSFAGLYASVLDVLGPEALRAAILEVWKSYFSYPALLERFSLGLGSEARMAVMVQPMVAARYAGVFFTADPLKERGGGVVEYVKGRGDGLVAGMADAVTVDEAAIRARRPPPFASAEPLTELFSALRQLLATAELLRRHFGRELDIEWAFDGHRPWILQLRPISTLATRSELGGRGESPVFEWVPLYAASEEELERFAPLPGFAAYFRSKRGPLFRFAAELGVATSQALLLRFDRPGLADDRPAALLRHFSSAEIVVDAHEGYRQRILLRRDVARELAVLAPLPGKVRQVVLRDYVRGEKGLISRAEDDGSVIYEVADEGLLALNRGTAGGRTFHRPPEELAETAPGALEPGPPELPPSEAARFFATTLNARQRFGPCQLEWVLSHGRLLIVDYSPLDEALPLSADRRILSPGYAVGTVVRLEQEDALRRLSEGPAISLKGGADHLSSTYLLELRDRLLRFAPRPIVLVTRPFAALAALLPDVGGFIFERGSTLCHLAILLRESGVPAIESGTAYASLRSGARITLDTDARGDSGVAVSERTPA